MKEKKEMLTHQKVKDLLIPYFKGKDEISLAFLFGSRVKDVFCLESDVDIAIFNLFLDLILETSSEAQDLIEFNLDTYRKKDGYRKRRQREISAYH